MKPRALSPLRFLIAALVIAFVATKVPWDDRLESVSNGVVVHGTITGDWTGDEVSFLATPGEVVPEALVGQAADQIRAGAPVSVVRGGSYRWEPGLLTAISGLDPASIFGVLAAVFGGFLFGVTRWWRLLVGCGVATPYVTVMRLTMLGMFFNLVVPGLTGGDIVKAGLAAKEHPEGKGSAVMAVGLDRLIGLWALLMIAFVSAVVLRESLGVLVAPLGLIAIGATGGFIVLGAPLIRDALGAKRVMGLIPARFSGFVDALRSLSERPGEFFIAVVLSLGNHACIGLAVFAVARGIGDETSFLGCLAATVVASAVSAVPLAPGGWGVGEAAYAAMFSLLGSGEAVGFAVSVSYRLCQTAISLLCGAALWRGSRKEWAAELDRSKLGG